MNRTEALARMNEVAGKTWLIVRVEVVDYDLKRRAESSGVPMAPTSEDDYIRGVERLRLQVDGFTQVDALVEGDDLKILGNACLAHLEGLEGNYAKASENNAFINFQLGKVVSWDDFCEAVEQYVQLSVDRLTNL